MGSYSRLDAVNKMYFHSGEAIVATLDGSTSQAEYILDMQTKEFQTNGLANNVYVVKVYPDSNGDIILREDAISCDLLSSHVTDDNRIIRGMSKGDPKKLFNVTELTYTWDQTEEYVLKYVLHVDWEDMDTAVQNVIMLNAARQYQILMQGDATTDAYLAEQVMSAAMKAQAKNAESGAHSVFGQVGLEWVNALGRGPLLDSNYYRYPIRRR